MNALRQWLEGLAPRERNLVYVAAALLAVAVVYFVLVLPVTTAAAQRAARIEQKKADLLWMRQVAPQLAAAAAAGGTAGNESLVVLADRTGREAGLSGAIRDQSPEGEHGLRLRLEAAPFDVMVTWLGSLQQQYGVRIDTATISTTGAPGLINANITLSNGPTPGS